MLCCCCYKHIQRHSKPVLLSLFNYLLTSPWLRMFFPLCQDQPLEWWLSCGEVLNKDIREFDFGFVHWPLWIITLVPYYVRHQWTAHGTLTKTVLPNIRVLLNHGVFVTERNVSDFKILSAICLSVSLRSLVYAYLNGSCILETQVQQLLMRLNMFTWGEQGEHSGHHFLWSRYLKTDGKPWCDTEP